MNHPHLILPMMLTATIPFVLTLAAKVGVFGRRDNHETRKWQAAQTGWRQRAVWAHQNAFESMPMFFAAALVLHLGGPVGTSGILLTWAYPLTRIAYSACYLADVARLRTSVFFASMGVVIAMFVSALVRG